MDTFNPNQMPPMPTAEGEKKSIGPLVAVIIILALIIVGGLYFLKERSAQENYVPIQPAQNDSSAESLRQQSDSDDLNSIEADLNATNLDNLDQGAAALQAEFNAQQQ